MIKVKIINDAPRLPVFPEKMGANGLKGRMGIFKKRKF